MQNLLIYLPPVLALFAAVVAIKGGTWKGNESGIKNLTITGWFAATIAVLSCLISVVIIYKANESAESYASELRSSLGKINDKVDSQNKAIKVSHIMVDVPASLLNRDGRIVLFLERGGAALEITNNGPAMCYAKNVVTGDSLELHVGLCAPGAQFIYHAIEIEKELTRVNKKKIHLEIAIKNPFKIVKDKYFEIRHPAISVSELSSYDISYDAPSREGTFYGCPHFLIFNKSYNQRYVLCRFKVQDQEIDFEGNKQEQSVLLAYE